MQEHQSPAPDNAEHPPKDAAWPQLGLSPDTLDLISKAGYVTPSAVQLASIPYALEGRDLIVSAQTGSGKTASFVLPMVERFVGRRGTFGLILAPTREIAQQIQATLDLFAKPRGLNSVVLIGGIDMDVDVAALQGYPDIIVGTPGRVCDHLERGNLWLDFIEMVVLDEADRMLSMGFSEQLSRIMDSVPESRQTLLFSATFLPPVEKLARRILYDPVRVAIGKPLQAAPRVEQRAFWVREDGKQRELLRLLREEPGSVMIFVRTKDAANRLWMQLHALGFHDATYLSSDRAQNVREHALAEFKAGQFRILVATDVAGRGIHVEGVAHVVNYDLPLEPEDYIHRIGRTGRVEASGKATSFVTGKDRRLLVGIERLLGHSLQIEGTPPSASREHDGHGGRPGGHGRGTGRGGRGHGRSSNDAGRGTAGGRGRRRRGGAGSRRGGGQAPAGT